MVIIAMVLFLKRKKKEKKEKKDTLFLWNLEYQLLMVVSSGDLTDDSNFPATWMRPTLSLYELPVSKLIFIIDFVNYIFLMLTL